jgi:hypothetical protein
LPSGFPTKNPVHVSLLSHACHIPCPPHFPWFDLPNNIRWWVQITKLSTVQLSPLPKKKSRQITLMLWFLTALSSLILDKMGTYWYTAAVQPLVLEECAYIQFI